MCLSRTLTWAITVFMFGLLVGSPAAAQNTQKSQGAGKVEENEAPLLVFKSIELAWQAGNAQALASLAGGSRVFVEIRGIERRGGYFTRPQIFYLFKDMFAATTQSSFVFVRYQNLDKQDSRIYGMALRSYKDRRSGGLYRDKVFVTLVKDGSRWAVAEIKSTW